MIALNAKTGDEYWRYKRQLPDDLFQLHPTSRGVGLWDDKLYLATTDDHVVALDAKTGKVVWDTKVQDYKKGQYMTLMPLIIDGKVIVGGSGGELGVRGYVAALRRQGRQGAVADLYHPRPGEPGHDTWQGDDWKNRRRLGLDDRQLRSRTPRRSIGASATPRRGPAIHIPATISTPRRCSALDPATGKIKTHFQYHQNDSWDWDEV